MSLVNKDERSHPLIQGDEFSGKLFLGRVAQTVLRRSGTPLGAPVLPTQQRFCDNQNSTTPTNVTHEFICGTGLKFIGTEDHCQLDENHQKSKKKKVKNACVFVINSISPYRKVRLALIKDNNLFSKVIVADDKALKAAAID